MLDVRRVTDRQTDIKVYSYVHITLGEITSGTRHSKPCRAEVFLVCMQLYTKCAVLNEFAQICAVIMWTEVVVYSSCATNKVAV